ncbi:MAG: hypothetical protein WAT19_03105 [Ferruginibacter sp.]
MHKTLASLLLLFIQSACFAQKDNAPTPFDKFVSSKKIQWAACFSNAVSENNLLKNAIIKNFKDGRIKACKGISFRYPDANELKEVSYSGLQQSHTYDPLPANDSQFNKLTAQQVIYVYKDKLYSYVPWVNITAPVTTPGGTYLGVENLLSTAVNKKYCKRNFNPKDSAATSVTYIAPDSVPKYDQLKNLYGNNLVDAIWPMMEAGKLAIFYTANNEPVKRSETGELLTFAATAIPSYDENGNLTGTKTVHGSFRPGLFKKVAITQTWFYHKKQNRFSSRITQLILYSDVKGMPDEAGENGYYPQLKILF